MRVYGTGMGDADPPEPAELAYEILDRKGYKAKWLERYVTPEVDMDITEQCLIMIEGERRENYYEQY